MNTEAMRAQFEAWAIGVGMNTQRTDSGLCYVSDYTDDAWEGYQAALSSPAVVALQRADVLVRLLTVRQVIEAGDEAIEAAGLNPWCVNEGLADGSERISLWRIDAALAPFTTGAGHVE